MIDCLELERTRKDHWIQPLAPPGTAWKLHSPSRFCWPWTCWSSESYHIEFPVSTRSGVNLNEKFCRFKPGSAQLGFLRPEGLHRNSLCITTARTMAETMRLRVNENISLEICKESVPSVRMELCMWFLAQDLVAESWSFVKWSIWSYTLGTNPNNWDSFDRQWSLIVLYSSQIRFSHLTPLREQGRKKYKGQKLPLSWWLKVGQHKKINKFFCCTRVQTALELERLLAALANVLLCILLSVKTKLFGQAVFWPQSFPPVLAHGQTQQPK